MYHIIYISFTYISNSMGAYLQPKFSYRLYTKIICQKKAFSA